MGCAASLTAYVDGGTGPDDLDDYGHLASKFTNASPGKE